MKTKRRLILPIFLLTLLLGFSIAGGLWWYDTHVDRSGWVEQEDGTRYYRDFHGERVSGWLTLDDGTYYLEDGVPYTGWLDWDGCRYYLDSSGVMVTGWLEEGGKTHFFGDNGRLVEGWLWLGADRYYLDGGNMVTGFLELEGSTYYFGEDGIMCRGFQAIGENTYYFDDDGHMAVGQTQIEDNTYLFGEGGVMYTGWLEEDGNRYYYSPEGVLAVGWQEMEDGRRYFDESGAMAVGWYTLGEDTCYFDSEGIAASGPTEIDGVIHYFSPLGIEVILVNALNPLPSYFDQELVNVVDYHNVDSRCYSALVQMLADCEAAGIEYVFNSAYRTLEEQVAILETRTQEHMAEYGLNFEEGLAMALETVAIPNTSEHQLGLSVDLLGDEAIPWFQEHCWEYGFILRYPEGKEEITGITNESWHFRYVGLAVAQDMKDSGLCLEEYLGAEAVTPERKKAAQEAYIAEREELLSELEATAEAS